jgi:hypothetical protein
MNTDKLARKARGERQQQIDALVQTIIDSGLYDDEEGVRISDTTSPAFPK